MGTTFSQVAIAGGSVRPTPSGAASQPPLPALLAALPGGEQSFWGVPFTLFPAAAGARWVWIGPGAMETATIELSGAARYVVLAHFSVPSRPLSSGSGPGDELDGVPFDQGEHLADYVLAYVDGVEHKVGIRRHFEIGDVSLREHAFVARPHQSVVALNWRGPHKDGEWGQNQMGSAPPPLLSSTGLLPHYWIHALLNPRPDAELAGIRLEARGSTAIALAGISLYHGIGDPLRHRRLETLRVALPPGRPLNESARVDLGIVARQTPAQPFDPELWLAAPYPGWGSPPASPPEELRTLLVEVSASEGATMEIAGERIGLGEVFTGGSSTGDGGHVRVELVRPDRQWVSVSIADASTGGPTPARVHFRSPDGQYLPPYGHRHEVNDRWFEDYGADLQLGGTAYAYVDGRFDIELPVGAVYVEVVKGFEYAPIRSVIQVDPGLRHLTLPLERVMDWRQRGWISADTHVHFLSPQTAWLEAQAEGVNVVNLLATQWGDLYTNWGDMTGRLSGVSRDDTLIWVGTENRQHVLGHISLLGIQRPTTPVCAGGPQESYIGDPVWSSMAEWADSCRDQDGVVVVPHFPGPYCENVADVVLGKVDGLELRDFEWGANSHAVREWYRLLNCGYRVAAVGGTDKMSAGMPVGGVRTYAHTGDEELSFSSWAKAVRGGRTMTSSGPLIELTVEGHPIGDSISVPSGGGTLSVRASAVALQPLSSLEVVLNGRVVLRVDGASGETRLELSSELRVDGGGWIAARCMGPTVLWHIWPIRTAAHTSPVYLVGKDGPPAAEGDRTHLTTILDGGLAWLDTLAIRADDARHERVRQVFLDARRRIAGNHAS